MPEVNFSVRWPDGSEQNCYSPSTIIQNYLQPDTELSVEEFLTAATGGLNEASERVRQKYGMACSSAMDQLQRIEQKSKKFSENDRMQVMRVG